MCHELRIGSNWCQVKARRKRDTDSLQTALAAAQRPRPITLSLITGVQNTHQQPVQGAWLGWRQVLPEPKRYGVASQCEANDQVTGTKSSEKELRSKQLALRSKQTPTIPKRLLDMYFGMLWNMRLDQRLEKTLNKLSSKTGVPECGVFCRC